MPVYEASTTTTASPEAAWAAWTDVAGWRAFDTIEAAEIDGEFRTGAVIRTKARGFPKSTLIVTTVERPGLWVDESRSPGVRMRFDHVIESNERGTTLTERFVISGPLARVVGPLLRRKLEALFTESVANVARAAEQAETPAA